jgi:hypothetical protein
MGGHDGAAGFKGRDELGRDFFIRMKIPGFQLFCFLRGDSGGGKDSVYGYPSG